MMYTCFVHLQRHNLFDARAFKAGHCVVRMSSQLSDEDYQYLDPIIGVSDSCFAICNSIHT